MKTIPLTQGKVALVDDEDFEWLNQWKWHYRKGHPNREKGYAGRSIFLGTGKRGTVLMHREILKVKKGQIPDHHDGDGLNNQRSNLRVGNMKDNSANRSKVRSKCSSKYKGVSWHKASSYWRASIKKNQKWMHIGSFQTEEDAAKAYDKKASELFGTFAKLNFC